MKPAEVIAVAVSIPLVVLVIASDIGADRRPAPTPAGAARVQPTVPALADEIVVTAKRVTART